MCARVSVRVRGEVVGEMKGCGRGGMYGEEIERLHALPRDDFDGLVLAQEGGFGRR